MKESFLYRIQGTIGIYFEQIFGLFAGSYIGSYIGLGFYVGGLNSKRLLPISKRESIRVVYETTKLLTLHLIGNSGL